MSEITNVLAVSAVGAGPVRDLAALHDDPAPVADQYTSPAVTPGFRTVRETAEGVSVALLVADGAEQEPRLRAAWGDCVGGAHPGRCGRDSILRAAHGLSAVRSQVAPLLQGRKITSFREIGGEIDALTAEVQVPAPEPEEPDPPPNLSDAAREGLSRRDLFRAPFRALRPERSTDRRRGRGRTPSQYMTVERPLHPAVRYGVSQALLRAVALERGITMAQVIADEWGLPEPTRAVLIHAQSGGDRREDADKMIVRRIDSLPHALIEDVPLHLGQDGEQLVRYVRWLKGRIQELGGPDYRPDIHLDVHGALGRIYQNNLGRILGYLYRLESQAEPYALRVEDPILMESRAEQIDAMKTLREYVGFRKMALQIVADQWISSLEDLQAFIGAGAADMIHISMPDLGSISTSVDAVLACKQAGVASLLGGSWTETDLAARAAAHVALATQPDLILARPGSDVDAAVSTVQNEMTRTLVLIKARPT